MLNSAQVRLNLLKWSVEWTLKWYSLGSLKTLNRTDVDVYAELVNFYNTYYSANIMKFAIIGRGEASPPPLPHPTLWLIYV